jgi:Flp pilus assembly protein TadG
MRRRALAVLVRRDGATALEFALIALPLLLLVCGIMDFGRMVWTEATLHRAVEDAARCASVNATLCGSTAATAAYAAGRTPGLGIGSSAFTVTAQSCGNEVAATYPFAFVFSGFFPFSVTLTASACFPS